ncbi:hypothetical protein C7S16_4793 [Burkholderia thailandensis]|uniref:Uncharacterized protein n=1 Tax=Burkholderia thailandensis TaxID=57975 RepID=A0AAW9CU54_BURTH|nr:hypothetical protein [Burkholderia thailandensis]
MPRRRCRTMCASVRRRAVMLGGDARCNTTPGDVTQCDFPRGST